MKNIFCAFLILASVSSAYAADAIDTALASPTRPAEDKKVDENRHPRELLQFAQIKSGDTVVDFIPGKGYFTRLFTSLVGPKGHVIAYVPKELESSPYKIVEGAQGAVAGAKNAEVKVTPILEAPATNVDVIWTSQNYHDLHVKSLFPKLDVIAANKVLFKMLKPGGHLIIVDHVAPAGTDDAGVEKLHRIDPAVVRKEVEAVGFVFDGESKTLERKEDHKLNVFDPAIRGKTDQFAYRFVKPKK
ncbi:class I SAM-dependent methyltransferase [Bdellovibrio sp. NC01]|uniref:class I SAM-dependent methyltransferase n=1 Tax=Bdellovibrio sp. NC01 TaxID=2220073 RepID=UPI00115BDEC6|nr:class I SAM-dependent methyltransferase [Bdellovibrio sp. NC01]QDK39361.1 methyltransferase [Bdellovibrio sp. NC01]